MPLSHYIARITVNLKVPDAVRVQDLQQEVSTFCRTEVQALLSDMFDELSDNRVIRLDRLEVVLDPFKDVDAFQRNFVSDLGVRIRNSLEDALDRPPPSVMDGDKALPADMFAAEWKTADLFMNLLEHGAAPWTSEPEAFHQALRVVPDLLSCSREFRDTFKKLLKGSFSAVKRLTMQLEQSEFSRIIEALTNLDAPWILEVLQAVENLFERFEPASQVHLNARYVIIETAFFQSVDKEGFAGVSLTATLEKIFPALHLTFDQQKWFLTAVRGVSERFSGKLGHLFKKALDDFTVNHALEATHDSGAVELFERESIVRNDLHGINPKDESREFCVDKNDLKLTTEFPVDSTGPDAYHNTKGIGSLMSMEKRHTSKAEEDPNKDQRESSDKDYTELNRFPCSEADKAHTKMAGDVQAVHSLHPDAQSETTDKGSSNESLSDGENREQNRAKGIDIQAEHGKLGNGVQGEHSESAKGPFAGSEAAGIDSRMREHPLPWLTPYTETFHIHNAGLVLTAPFFRSVFKDLNYLNNENQFVDNRAQIRAVHFTQFLVTGENYPPECDLVLNKILCGFQLEEPLERFIKLDKKEQDVAMDLLVSAIGHWKTLKKTSAPVFRETFLRHFGILERQDESRRLRIERTAIDVLIDTLPWTISVIKHPWMHRPLMVEW